MQDAHGPLLLCLVRSHLKLTYVFHSRIGLWFFRRVFLLSEFCIFGLTDVAASGDLREPFPSAAEGPLGNDASTRTARYHPVPRLSATRGTPSRPAHGWSGSSGIGAHYLNCLQKMRPNDEGIGATRRGGDQKRQHDHMARGLHGRGRRSLQWLDASHPEERLSHAWFSRTVPRCDDSVTPSQERGGWA